MNNAESLLQDKVRELLSSNKIDLFIGFEKGTLPLTSRPVFIKSDKEADRLVWDAYGRNNLAVYLPRYFKEKQETFPTIGIACRGCTARSMNGLIRENQIPPDKVKMIGMPCHGLIDRGKVLAKVMNTRIREAWEKDSEIHITLLDGEVFRLEREQVLADACLDCAFPSLDNMELSVKAPGRAPAHERHKDVNAFEALPATERLREFTDQLAKCIRCNACRQACPNCFCKVCFADQASPGWVGPGNDLSDVMLFHIGRIFHQAGRCTECGACARACPVHIDLRLFTGKLAKDAEQLFGQAAGLSATAPPVLSVYSEQDSQDFITEPQ